MKKLLLFSCVAVFAAACTNNATPDTKTTDTTKTADTKMAGNKDEKLDLPYKLDHPYAEWQPGNEQHALTVMKSLKAFETNDLANCFTAFGDTVDIRMDNYHAVLSHDSLVKMFTAQRGDIANLAIKMGDWESVISADKKEEWVTLWYKQITTDKKGKTDSMGVVDDAKMQNGKIVVLDEKIQHLPAAKK